MSEPSVCPDCGNGWTFDFQQRRVYCRTCEEGKAMDARLTQPDGSQAIGSATPSSSSSVPVSSCQEGAKRKRRPLKLVEALNRRVPFAEQDPDEQFYPARCGDDRHYWHEDADAEGDTCNCGAWYRFADRMERTPRC